MSSAEDKPVKTPPPTTTKEIIAAVNMLGAYCTSAGVSFLCIVGTPDGTIRASRGMGHPEDSVRMMGEVNRYLRMMLEPRN